MFLLILTISATACAFFFCDKIKKGLIFVHYEAVYWLLGAASLTEDLIYAWKNKINDLTKSTGQVAVITGGGRGIGLEVVKRLLACDMHVIIGCRSVETVEKKIENIRSSGLKSGTTLVLPLDTGSLSSVRKFAEKVLATSGKIHLLINNAGIMFVPHTLTEDKFESQLCVNYLGHSLLTHLLLPKLKQTGQNSNSQTRIVHVSSCAHIAGSIQFEDINFSRTLYIPSKAYAQSKLAQLMFSKALDRRLRNEGAKVSSFSVHPGVVNTELFDGTFLKLVAPWAPKLFFKTPEQGSRSIIFTCMSDELEDKGGSYISNCRVTWVSKTANDVNQQEKLMEKTSEMLKIKL